MLTYNDCKILMSTCRSPTRGKPMAGPSGWGLRHGKNTRLYHGGNTALDHEGGYYTLKYHGNTIANIYSDGWELHTQGWHTVSTKARLNVVLPPEVRVRQRNYELQLHTIGGAPTSGGIHSFDDFREGVFVSTEHPRITMKTDWPSVSVSPSMVWHNRATFRLFRTFMKHQPTWLMDFHAKQIAIDYINGAYDDDNLMHLHMEWYNESKRLVQSLYTDDTDRHGMIEFFAFLERRLNEKWVDGYEVVA